MQATLGHYPPPMDWNILWYVVAGIIIVAGFVASILPNLPGIPVMFGGMLLAAWVGHFQKIPVWVVVFLAIIAAFSIVFDFLAGTYGAKRYGASKAAVWGAFIGTIIEYPIASIMLREEPNLTLAVGSKFYLYEQRYLWGDFAAAAVLSGLPITLVFLLAQRWIVSGLTAGGVKG